MIHICITATTTIQRRRRQEVATAMEPSSPTFSPQVCMHMCMRVSCVYYTVNGRVARGLHHRRPYFHLRHVDHVCVCVCVCVCVYRLSSVYVKKRVPNTKPPGAQSLRLRLPTGRDRANDTSRPGPTTCRPRALRRLRTASPLKTGPAFPSRYSHAY